MPTLGGFFHTVSQPRLSLMFSMRGTATKASFYDPGNKHFDPITAFSLQLPHSDRVLPVGMWLAM